MIRLIEREISKAELDRVHAGFDEHQREHGNVAPPQTRQEIALMDGDAFVGCSSGLRDNRWYYLSDLWIEKSHRGRGLGRQLLRAWEDSVSSTGFRSVYTWTAGFQAPEFYLKQGYEMFAEFRDYYQNGHSRIGLRKRLDQAIGPLPLRTAPNGQVVRRGGRPPKID